jgi:cephalosporin hydroxylase
MEAVEAFLREQEGFVIDWSCEKFFMTRNPNGFLRRERR